MIGVPIVVKPVVVPVPHAIVVAVEVQDITVTVRVEQNRVKRRLYHRP